MACQASAVDPVGMATRSPHRPRRRRLRTRATSLASLVAMAVGVTMLAKGANAGVAWAVILIGLAIWTGDRD